MKFLKKFKNNYNDFLLKDINDLTNEFFESSSDGMKKNFNKVVKDGVRFRPSESEQIQTKIFKAITSKNIDLNYLVSRIKNIDFKNGELGYGYSVIESDVYHILDLERIQDGRLADIKYVDPYKFLYNLFYLIIFRTKILSEIIDPIINRYGEILARKRNQLIIEDDYGDLYFEDWDKELENFYNKKIQFELNQYIKYLVRTEKRLSQRVKIKMFVEMDSDSDSCEDYDSEYCEYDGIPLWLSRIIDIKIDAYEMRINHYNKYDNLMSGEDYENFIKDIIIDSGIKACKTKQTGDQGVDVIATVNQKRVAIQCKHYNSSKVGNDSVQQVYSAKNFYDCELCLVVTNNEFTKSAKQLAAKLNVILLYHDDLIDFLKEV